jgi:hypothetical protein
MIKLLTILKEMAISNAWSGEKGKLGEETDTVIEAATAMGLDNPVLWRGTGGVKVPGQRRSAIQRIMRVTGDRQAFRGGHSNAMKVLQLLGIKHPVFAHFDRAMTEFFGTPCAIVLEQPYKIYQSSRIDDLMAGTSDWETKYTPTANGTLGSSEFKQKTEQELQDAADTYKQINGKSEYNTESGSSREVLIDVTNYWAIPCGSEIKTYGDLVQLLESYKAKFA